jgi:hypothetical protein
METFLVQHGRYNGFGRPDLHRENECVCSQSPCLIAITSHEAKRESICLNEKWSPQLTDNGRVWDLFLCTRNKIAPHGAQPWVAFQDFEKYTRLSDFEKRRKRVVFPHVEKYGMRGCRTYLFINCARPIVKSITIENMQDSICQNNERPEPRIHFLRWRNKEAAKCDSWPRDDRTRGT